MCCAHFWIEINNYTLQKVSEFKYLSMIINYRLKSKNHYIYLIKKVSQKTI